MMFSPLENVWQNTEVNISLSLCRDLVREAGLKPPRRSAESDSWFMLTTFSLRPVFSAKNWTEVVLPTPVSPTRRTGSLLVTALATASRRMAACQDTEKTDWSGARLAVLEQTGSRTRPTLTP